MNQATNTPTTAAEAVPPGFMQNAQGHLVPDSMVKPIDKLRDQTVMALVAKARALNQALAEFKRAAFGDISAFVQTSAEQYEVVIGGDKGNVTLRSFDGRYRIDRAVQDSITFGEQLQAAKALIDQCITAWSTDARDELKMLVNDAFAVDKTGQVNTARVLRLRNLAINDPLWLRAMQAIQDSITVAGSRSYVRVYERVGQSDQYMAIPLDLAAV